MKLEAWKFLTQSWDRADRERERLEKATHTFFEDIMRDNWEGCTKLIERGCSVNMALGQKTAVMVAAEYSAINTLRLLVSTGANIGAQDEQGRDALFWAIETRSDEAVDFLLSRNARPKRLFNDNSTPLIAAAKSSYVYGVRALVEHDQKLINMYDRMGRTALWHVLSKEDMTDDDNEIARILMDKGANPDLADLEGVTARESAMSESGRSLIERQDINHSIDMDSEPSSVTPPSPTRRPRL